MDANVQQYGQMNFNLPHDVVQLPSGGIFYKSKKKSVKIGYLTASDENIILNQTEKDSIILSLIRNKMYETDLRPEELTEGDVEAIMIFLRNTAFGAEYKFTLNDPGTQKTFQTIILLDELNIKKPQVSPDENGCFSTTLPKSGAKIKLKPVTFGDTLEIEQIADTYPAGRVVPRVTWKLVRQIVEIDGNVDKQHISQFIETMPIADSKYIREFLNNNEPKLDLSRQVTAPSGEKVNVNISFGVEFFRPFF